MAEARERLQERTGPGLRRSELEFRRLLDKLPVGAYTCDNDGLITYFNQHAVDLWGRAPKLNDPIDRFCGSFRLFAADGRPITHDQCWMALALRNNRGYNSEEIIVERPDGHRLTVLAHANPIHDDLGNVISSVNVLVDITARKQAEVALAEAGRQKDEFLATLAHELRNPLAPIRNAVEYLNLHSPKVPDLEWARSVISRQVAHMVRLIDDLLDVSRITCSKLELNKIRVELEEILRAAVETSRPLIEQREHELQVSGAAEPVFLDADPVRLSEVVSNLLNNAAKFTEPGGHIWLSAQRDGGEAVISVRDDGIGLEADMLSRIFDMFIQADRSLERSGSGLGIGLTLAQRLVELHGGRIEARSEGLGKGSEFVVWLPIVEVVRELPQTGTRSGQPVTIAGLRILIVDDNQDSAAALYVLLQKMGNNVRAAGDGLEALRAAEEFRPDVVLLDIGLPGINGYDVAERIRQKPWGRRTALIAVSGWGRDADCRRATEAGFDHHMVKPIETAALIEVLGSLGLD